MLDIVKGYGPANRIFEFLGNPSNDKLDLITGKMPRLVQPVEIIFSNVSFSYEPSTKILEVLLVIISSQIPQEFSLTIPTGTKCAFVGESGAGKV